MSAQTGAGIQELMAAETRASQIVAEARMGEFCGSVCVDSCERGEVTWMRVTVTRVLVVLHLS